LNKIERKKTKQVLGIDKCPRNKDHAKYVPRLDGKANCLTGAIGAVNCFVISCEDGFGPNSLTIRMPTPIECERLQGFPDNWTYVPYEDRMMSDTQRYKQTGNAVTVNVLKHIFLYLKSHLISTKQSFIDYKGRS